jgi:hypothetical protein
MFFCNPGLVFGATEGFDSRFHVLLSRTRFRRYRGLRLSFSCFALSDSFWAVTRASTFIFMFCAPGNIFDGTEGVDSCFMFCAPRLVFGSTEGVHTRFHVLRAQTRFRRYRRRRVPFSCFALPDTFSAMRRTLGPVFKFCAPELIFGGSEGVGSRFHVLHPRTRFRRYRGC